MAIRVELYGMARQRAGLGQLELDLPDEVRLGDVLMELAQRVPALGNELLHQGRLHSSLAANLDGQRFVSDPDAPVRDGQCVLILSADAGG